LRQILYRLAKFHSIFAYAVLEVALRSNPICAPVVSAVFDDTRDARVDAGAARVDAGGPRLGPPLPVPSIVFAFFGGVGTAVYGQYKSAIFCT